MNEIEFSLVIPMYNEAGNVVPLLDAIRRALTGIAAEIIIVDDHSPDGTAAVAQQYATAHPDVRVIERVGERGLSSAVLKGFEAAQGSILGVIDGDQSHDERILPALIEAIRKGADLAVGSRRVPGGGADKWPWHRRLTSNIATGLAHWLVGRDLSDPMSGYFCIRRAVYDASKPRLRPEGYKILLELYCKGRPKSVREIPFVFRDRTQGYSKLTPWVMGEFLHMVWELRRQKDA